MAKINFAIVGCGRISIKHAEAIFYHNKYANLVAACDTDIKRAKKMKKKYRVSKIYDKFDELLKDENIDVVSICTPSGFHAEMAVAAMKAGKDVVIEKPIAMNVHDALMIERIAKSTGRLALPVMQNRFNDAIQLVKKRIKNCGKILHISVALFWYRPQIYYNDGVHGGRKMDGGVLFNQGVHYIDVITYFMGEVPKQVYADGGTYAHKMECEDTIALTMKYKDRRIASFCANTIAYPKNFEGSITLFCEKATIKISGTALNLIEYWSGNGSSNIDIFGGRKNHDIYGYGHILVYKNFLDFKRNGIGEYITMTEAIGSVKIMESAYKSLLFNKPVKV